MGSPLTLIIKRTEEPSMSSVSCSLTRNTGLLDSAIFSRSSLVTVIIKPIVRLSSSLYSFFLGGFISSAMRLTFLDNERRGAAGGAFGIDGPGSVQAAVFDATVEHLKSVRSAQLRNANAVGELIVQRSVVFQPRQRRWWPASFQGTVETRLVSG